jgi:hypothetical protein
MQRVKTDPDWRAKERCARLIRRQQGLASRLWIIFFTMLALVAVHLIETFTARQSPAEAASTLVPVLSPPGGYYDRDVQLEIPAPDSSSYVVFTTDGSVPTLTNGTMYTQTIRLSAATPVVTVIRARAVLPGARLGPAVSASYFVGVPATLPMMSLIVDPGDLWDSERGIYANPLQRGDTWERPVGVTYVDKDRHLGFHIPAGLRVHGGVWNRSFDKKSLRLYFRQEYGASRLEYPLFANSDVQSFKRLILYSGGQDWHAFPHTNWTLLRTPLVDNLAFELGGYATHSQPALLFINGRLWGIYQIRERLDRRFLPDHHGIESADFLEGPEFATGQDILMGGRENWDHLLQFVEAHGLPDPANYAYVQSQVDIANFIDYNILQIYAANTDWPLQNEYQFRPRVQGGRWRWLFWDSDYSFGLIHYGDVSWNMIDRALDYNHPETGGRDLLLLRKLLENPVFFNRFLSRTADLLNTTLAPQSVIAYIDALAAELEPDIPYEATRWSSSVNWESSVQGLRDFARRRPDFVRQHVVERFNLNGTARLTFNPPDSSSGYLAVNGFLVQDLPWQGIYFQRIPVQVIAVPVPGFRFAGWDLPDLPQTPVITLTVNTPMTLTPLFKAVTDDVPRPGDVIFAAYQMDEDSHVRADSFELLVMRASGVDLRGWRVTDNDTKTATDEGSMIFTDKPAFAHVPRGTTIQIIASQSAADLPARVGDGYFPPDDLDTWDRQMILYAGNGNLDIETDPGFNLGSHDNLVLLAPGPTQAFGDDQGIAFVAESTAVTPATFGVLPDGVLPTLTTADAQLGQQMHSQMSTWGLAMAGLVMLYLNLNVRLITGRNHRRLCG